jgi:two-component sensor histidine kinase
MDRLGLSVWPFVILAPGELLGAVLIRRTSPSDSPESSAFVDSLPAIAAGLVVSVLCILVARRLIEKSRSTAGRGVPVAIVVYVITAIASGLVMVLMLIDVGPAGYPAILTVLYMITRPVNILILAFVVQLLRDGIATTRNVDAITRDQLFLARRTNEMIEAAERDLRAESLRMFAQRVAEPLRRIVRDGPDLDNQALANRIDDFIEVHLRPMAAVLHPVSVRLGLISAMRSLNPDVMIDAAATVARMDADGVLLDDDVRLQLYRWLRSGLPTRGTSRAALVIRGRELHVSLHPAAATPVDAVQAAAGMRRLGPGVVSVPLRGQVVDVLSSGTASPSQAAMKSPRYRLRDLLTAGMPIRLLLVTVLTIGAAPLPFVVYRWSPSLGTILASLASAASPIAMAALLDRLPPAKQNIAGAVRVVGEWLAISASAAVGVVVVGTVFAVLPPGMDEWGYAIFRISYRYALPGLIVTVSYGLVVESQRRLARAEHALRSEEKRRVEILAASRQLDRDVAEALHRNVQGRLAAAVIMLRLGQREEAWTQVIEMASVEVPWLLERMGEERMDRALIADPPMGLTVIQLDDPPVDQRTFDLLTRALGEIAVNARRHGRASTLVVSVHLDGGRCLLICEDDGTGLPSDTVPGLGSRLLDDTMAALAGSWTIEPSPPGCRVALDIPMGATARAQPTEPARASSGA